ncbi:MAG: UbiX family flavin prenyltransferase [Phycisphaerae bacterium]|jgi:4-hydroxy-3-polyprenylbenzoate decarboxylase
MRQIVVAITGASGAAYGRRLVQMLAAADVHLHLVVSPMGRRVLGDEVGLSEVTLASLIGHESAAATLYAHDDLGARLASGSFRTDGMAICPCSSHTLAAVAAGMGDNLITRAAAVTLKEGRRLIVVPREMPVTQIDLGNMLRISQAGGTICPASPGFYMRPQTVADVVDFVVGRVLDLLDVPHTLSTRWDPSQAARRAGEVR